jgi:hypothetical protein
MSIRVPRPPLPLPRRGHPLALAKPRRGHHHSSLTGSCGEPGALKGARRVREAARDNGTATTTVTASRADFHRPSPPLITQFIDEQRAVGHGVESICAVLREQGVPVAPRTYRSWRTSSPAARVVSDAQLVDKLRSPAPAPAPAHCPRRSTGAAR